jgi:5'-nucleotidase/UDP-sugar diphosphatase
MKNKILTLFCLSFFILEGCKLTDSKNKVEITILQLNDVYEMSPVSGGKLGGLARVQTLLKELRAKNPNTYTFLSGDLLSPSAIGTAKFPNSNNKLAGMQMVDILNKMDWDYFTLGNHEFDIGIKDLSERLDSMQFVTIIDNVLDRATMKNFRNTQRSQILNVDGVKIGLFGVMTDGYVYEGADVSDPFIASQKAVNHLKNKNVDIIIGITHLNIAEDVKIAEKISGINLILGGHEHENYYYQRGKKFTTIAKADANAKTVYVHHITYNKSNQKTIIKSDLVLIDSTFALDPEIDALVKAWTTKAFDYFQKKFDGDPQEEIGLPTLDLDGTEASVRARSTELTKLITKGFYNHYKESSNLGVDASIMNGGSIRIDDVLPAGKPVTLYDIIRISPFGGTISLVEINGAYLIQALRIGEKNKGSGAFLQYYNISKENDDWKIGVNKIQPLKKYKIAISTYLVDKGDTGLDIFTTKKGKTTKIGTDEPPFANVVKSQFKKDYPITE